jgi:DNA-binding NarL/FixJ family response regulator
MISLAVVDDHMIVQDGVRAMAERTDDIEFFGSASSGKEVFELLEQAQPDILLLDLRLAAEDGFDVCRALHARHPELRIVVFTAYANPALLRDAVEAGAVGYLLKDASTRRLPEIIRHVHEHGSYFDPRLSGRLLLNAFSTDSGSGAGAPQLNERESAILRLVAQGRTNAEIARELNYSSHTIKFHVSEMLDKFGVKRRTELVRMAVERDLLA